MPSHTLKFAVRLLGTNPPIRRVEDSRHAPILEADKAEIRERLTPSVFQLIHNFNDSKNRRGTDPQISIEVKADKLDLSLTCEMVESDAGLRWEQAWPTNVFRSHFLGALEQALTAWEQERFGEIYSANTFLVSKQIA